jgi:hypothetical protein
MCQRVVFRVEGNSSTGPIPSRSRGRRPAGGLHRGHPRLAEKVTAGLNIINILRDFDSAV